MPCVEGGQTLGDRPNRRGRRRRELLAAIAHSLELPTWASLVRRQGLPDRDAVELLVRLVRGV